MLPADHPLSPLQAQAALASGWPSLHLLVPSEAEAVGAHERIVACLGPVPQAELIEPWSDQEPWELRIDLPGLRAEDWERVREVVPVAVLVPGLLPGVRAAEDTGQRLVDPLVGGDLEARMAFDEAEGGILAPDLVQRAGDDEVEVLQERLLGALEECGLALRRDRMPVRAVVHRTTGRFGVQVWVPPEHLDPLPGDALLALRRTVVGAVAEVVGERALHPTVRLAPDLLWDSRFGLSVTAWIVGPAASPLPRGDAVDREVIVEGWLDRLDGLVDEVELQVVPVGPADHDAVVAAAVQVATSSSLPVMGRGPRWLRRGDGMVFCPTWGVAPGELAQVGRAVECLTALPGVERVRVVPGQPLGMAVAWLRSDVSWHATRRVWFVRMRDGLTDRDCLELVEPREPTGRDAVVDRALLEAATRCLDGASVVATAGGGVSAPVQDSRGREGLELALDAAEATDELRLASTLDALGEVRHPDLCSWASWGFIGGRALVRWWYRGITRPEQPRLWS